MSWDDRWRAGHTPWDRGAPAPPLLDLIRQDNLASGRALVPGCGAGYDAFALAAPDRFVIGLDLSPSAAERFAEVRSAMHIPEHRVEIVIADFFQYTPEAPFDVIWDYTFFCAIDPSLRPQWVTKTHELLADAGELITLLYPTRDPPPQGPPFLLDPDAVRELLAEHFVATHFAAPRSSHPDRLGRECLARWRKR